MVKVTNAVVALTVLAFFATPVEAQCCGGWRGWFGGAPAATTYYAPYTASYAPAGYGQVVNYVPQTSYRTVYTNAPVVAYSPVTACNACGGAMTVLRPVTSYVMQPRLVPYTTYRPVVVPTAPACGCGVPTAVAPVMATPAYYAPIVPTVSGYAPVPAPVAAPYNSGAPGTTVRSLSPSPAYPSQPGQPYLGAPAQSGPQNPSPATQPAPRDSVPADKTFENSKTPDVDSPSDQPQSRLRFPLKPESSNSNTGGTPRVLEPEDEDRTTALPIRQAFAVRQASIVSPMIPATPKLDDTGWRRSALSTRAISTLCEPETLANPSFVGHQTKDGFFNCAFLMAIQALEYPSAR